MTNCDYLSVLSVSHTGQQYQWGTISLGYQTTLSECLFVCRLTEFRPDRVHYVILCLHLIFVLFPGNFGTILQAIGIYSPGLQLQITTAIGYLLTV